MRKRIVMIGSSCIDEYYEMEHVPRLGEKTVLKPLGSRIGGMIGNAAAVAAAYGMEVYLMDRINGSAGKGGSTQQILEDCRMSGIRTDMIRFDDSLPDVKCLIFLKDGERIVYVIPTEKQGVWPDKEERDILRHTDYIYTSIEELKRFRKTAVFMEWMRASGAKIVLDVEYVHAAERETEWHIIQNADLIFINQEGDEQLKNVVGENYEKILVGGGSMVVKTKGAQGCEILSPDGEICRCGAYPVKPVDTTGAGDTFNASFVYGLCRGRSLKEAGEFANAAAARSILGMGARSGVTTEETVRKFMNGWRGERDYE